MITKEGKYGLGLVTIPAKAAQGLLLASLHGWQGVADTAMRHKTLLGIPLVAGLLANIRGTSQLSAWDRNERWADPLDRSVTAEYGFFGPRIREVR